VEAAPPVAWRRKESGAVLRHLMKFQAEPGTLAGRLPMRLLTRAPADPSAPRRVRRALCGRALLWCVLPMPPAAPADAHIRSGVDSLIAVPPRLVSLCPGVLSSTGGTAAGWA
jgi:hypothetical protein